MNSQNGAEEKKISQDFSSASKNPPDKPEDNFFTKGPSISLPKGGGALKNIDEKFEVNDANGTATFSMPLPLSKGRNNLQPELSLSYNSGSGNSIFGLGWSMSFVSIQRKTDKQLPRYFDNDESDVFMFTGVEDLVPALEQDNFGNWNTIDFTALTGERVKRYRPRIESGFHRIERITPKNSKIFYWKVTTSKNVVTIFGRSISARIVDPQNENKIFKW